MRSFLLAFVAAFALMLAHPSFAQSTPEPGNQPRAVGQQNPTPADASAPTDPTVPAEILAPPLQPADPLPTAATGAAR